MASEVLETEAYREMACFTGSVSTEGLKICRKIEKATGSPMFFYLHKYWGTLEEAIAGRPCPGCENAWRVELLDVPAKDCEKDDHCEISARTSVLVVYY